MKVVTVEQMRKIDMTASKKFGIPSLLLMENAGRSVADIAQIMVQNKKLRIAIFCGYGNNGGDGFVVARHLVNRGFHVDVFLVGIRKRMSDETRINLEIIKKMKIVIRRISVLGHIPTLNRYLRGVGLLIDGIFGIGVRGMLSPFYYQLIDTINKSSIPIVSIDVPSGFNADTGEVTSSAIRAQRTVTMGLLKKGFRNPVARKYLGKILVADISQCMNV